MPLSRAGFFRELRHGRPDGPSLRGSVEMQSPQEAEKIVSYLEGGKVLATTGSVVDDYLNASRQGIAKLEIVTDGVWVWPRDLAYYVREHRVKVPEDFVAHMRAQRWKPPELTPAELNKAEEDYLATA